MTVTILHADARKLPIADKSVDLVFCSPPYEAARTYGVDFKLRGQAWVDWAAECFMECLRVCRGLVAWVVEGQVRQYRWSATPALLMADLHRRGVVLRKPPIFHRVGVPGGGGNRMQHHANGGSADWFRNDYELTVCATASAGKLPWADTLCLGHPPKWAPGGEFSNRHSNGARVNQWGHSIASGATVVDEGGVVRSKGRRPSHVLVNGRDQWGGGTPHQTSGEGRNPDGTHKRSKAEKIALGGKPHTKRDAEAQVNGDALREQVYLPPAIANPGNVFKKIVGGGVMGSKLAHLNEAPFPLTLAEDYVRAFCPPGGTVLDCFCGSGTTMHAAVKHGRHGIASDIRESQCELTRRRVIEAQEALERHGIR